MNLPLRSETALKNDIYDSLMAYAKGHRNDEVLAQIVATWAGGDGMLPAWLGLSQSDFLAMYNFHFRGAPLYLPTRQLSYADDRLPEKEDLLALMLEHRAGRYIGELWLADIVVTACMGMDHLWQDLGLWSRAELSELLHCNFPALAAKNTQDMKWKKFLYKQLCEQQGIYICRAPSCDVCVDYAKCFGAED